MDVFNNIFTISPDILRKLITSLSLIVLLLLLKKMLNTLISKRVKKQKQIYRFQNISSYFFTIIGVVFVGAIWIKGFQSISTFLGLGSAGLAIAMHDTIANISGWVFILTRNPFKVGHRIQIGEFIGDVVDIRLFQFSVVEIGNWIDAEQSTGRIVNIPNSKVLREPLANYQLGFEYIWNEIPILITFESNWKKAKTYFTKVANQETEHLSPNAQNQIRRSAKKYMIVFSKLTPIVYLDVKDCGVMLTIRYLVNPQMRRQTQQQIWEKVLDFVDSEGDVDLAYPTMRYYTRREAGQANQNIEI